MSIRPTIAFAVLACQISGCIVVPIPVGAGMGIPQRPVNLSAPPHPCPVSSETDAAGPAALAGLNSARQAAGLAPLALAPRLTRVAQNHACDMAVTMQMTHVGSDGADLRTRLDRGGVAGNAWAENVGAGVPDAALMVAGWMNSPGHRANILNPAYGAAGVALSRDVTGRPYWALVLADRP